jgi:hypothetical protein
MYASAQKQTGIASRRKMPQTASWDDRRFSQSTIRYDMLVILNSAVSTLLDALDQPGMMKTYNDPKTGFSGGKLIALPCFEYFR